MSEFCIIGSGISGSTIANLLNKKYSVILFDKARGPGGRASNKRFKNNLSFDHGVQYISPKSKLFTKYIKKLHKNKILKSWDDNHLDFTFEKKPYLSKFIGRKANNDLVKYNLKNISLDLNDYNFEGNDLHIDFDNSLFGNEENEPRLFGKKITSLVL